MQRLKTILKSLTRISLAIIVFYATFMYVTKLINYPYEQAAENPNLTQVEEVESTKEPALIKNTDSPKVESKEDLVKILPVPSPTKKAKITLGKKNSIVFRDVVTMESTSLLLYEILKLDAKLPAGEPIYLALDTPGGSVTAGNTLIDALQALDRPVHTVSLFAASMGYHIVQNMDKRYITPNGTLMSHRVRIRGLSGQVPGEATVRLADILRVSNRMDERVAKRLGMPVQNYRRMIWDEYWTNGTDAIRQSSADQISLVKCGKDMTGTYKRTLWTFFGPIKLKWSDCALIRYPLEVDFSGSWLFSDKKDDDEEKEEEDSRYRNIQENMAYNRHLVRDFVTLYTNDREEFVRKYILTGRYQDILVEK